MPEERNFSLSEATALLPRLTTMLGTANEELIEKAELLANAYVYFEKCEQEMNNVKPTANAGFGDLRQVRLNFQAAIESLSQAKKDYLHTINFWIDEISDTGVILRDIKTGLLDFPAQADGFNYFWCWQLGENAITHWHTVNDGFTGRKPLVVLKEYL